MVSPSQVAKGKVSAFTEANMGVKGERYIHPRGRNSRRRKEMFHPHKSLNGRTQAKHTAVFDPQQELGHNKTNNKINSNHNHEHSLVCHMCPSSCQALPVCVLHFPNNPRRQAWLLRRPRWNYQYFTIPSTMKPT